MSITAAAILLVQAAAVQTPPALAQREMVQATATVRVIQAVTIDLTDMRVLREANAQINQTQDGTVWIEFP